MATKSTNQPADFEKLARRIYTRWINQKLSKCNTQIPDVITGLQDGINLIKLIEVLSEKTYTGKLDKNPKGKPQKIDNITNALNFCKEVGVQFKTQIGAEQIHDGNSAVLGFIFQIILRFIKFDDEESSDAKESLLMWVRNKVSGYPNLPAKVEKYGKDWHNGLLLCALIHKHRPKLIGDFNALKPTDGATNINKALDAANKYWGLEKFITPEEFVKLDENCMFIFVSEFYYGIAEARKIDLAAKRISKLIKLTKENDAMRAEYNNTSKAFKERMTKVEKLLADRTVDNTMAGAKKRLEEFYAFKTNDKNVLLGQQLDLEALYNNLAMRLAYHKRPEFIPPSGLSLKDIEAAVKHMEQVEQERQIALNAELNRQIRLLQEDDQHKSRHAKLKSWAQEKQNYLETREVIESVSAANLNLRLLDAFDKEYQATVADRLATLKSLAAGLVKEKYERTNEVEARQNEINAFFEKLAALSKTKRPILDDHLARELFKEKVRSWVSEHNNQFQELSTWIKQKTDYLNFREEVRSVAEARTQLSILEAYEEEKVSTANSLVSVMKKLGVEILAASYSTQYSSWKYEKPELIKNNEGFVDKSWVTLSELSAEKKRVLEDHLARETFKEKVLTMVRNHVDKFERLMAWHKSKAAYLAVKETVNCIADARSAIVVLESYEKERTRITDHNVKDLNHLGADILKQKYETKYSSYVYEQPQEITNRENQIKQGWEQLANASKEKRKVLDADLEREIEKENLRLEFASLSAEFLRFSKDNIENMAVTHFGFSLAEVEAFGQTLKNLDNQLNQSADKQEQEYKKVDDRMKVLKVTENVYTKNTVQDLVQARNNLNQAIQQRQGLYQKELERQRYNDKLCRDFAALADPLVKFISQEKGKITASKDDLEVQLKYVQAKINSRNEDGKNINNIKELSRKMEAAGITNNIHTPLTEKDVLVQWDQYGAFLEKKRKMLEEEIEHHKLRGVTPEQFQEIESNFKSFDINGDQKIDRKELRACLYSLGEEKNKTEIDNLLTKHGKNGEVPYANFKEMMIDILGVSDTKDDILASFGLINKAEVAVVEKLEVVLNEGDVDYIKKTAPAVSGGYNYKAWTDDVFSR